MSDVRAFLSAIVSGDTPAIGPFGDWLRDHPGELVEAVIELMIRLPELIGAEMARRLKLTANPRHADFRDMDDAVIGQQIVGWTMSVYWNGMQVTSAEVSL